MTPTPTQRPAQVEPRTVRTSLARHLDRLVVKASRAGDGSPARGLASDPTLAAAVRDSVAHAARLRWVPSNEQARLEVATARARAALTVADRSAGLYRWLDTPTAPAVDLDAPPPPQLRTVTVDQLSAVWRAGFGSGATSAVVNFTGGAVHGPAAVQYGHDLVKAAAADPGARYEVEELVTAIADGRSYTGRFVEVAR